MTTVTQPRPASTSTPARHRAPAPALVAAVVTGLMAAFGGYGALYFTGLEGWDDFGVTFAATYEIIAVTGVLSAVALARGSRLGWAGVLWYQLGMVSFMVVKLVTIQEWEALTFGLGNVVVLACLLRPATRAFASR